jgi:Predicted membrane-bound metal-dependent hydrolases
MDIVTHAAAGIVLGAPLLLDRPEAMAFFVFGSVFPDLDTTARVFGKMGFMKCHQTFMHSFFGIILCAICVPALAMWGFCIEFAIAFALGMLLHVLFDWSNSYGVMLFYPFSRKRYCRHYLFFIDLTVFLSSMIALAATINTLFTMPLQSVFGRIAAVYASVLILYVALHLLFHIRAKKLLIGRRFVLIPSALLPWQYYGAVEYEGKVTPLKLNALTKKSLFYEPITTLDVAFSGLLAAQPEYRTMHKLLPMYRAVDLKQDGHRLTLTCRELAIRNFGGRFGTLELTVDMEAMDENGVPQTIKKVFHV